MLATGVGRWPQAGYLQRSVEEKESEVIRLIISFFIPKAIQMLKWVQRVCRRKTLCIHQPPRNVGELLDDENHNNMVGNDSEEEGNVSVSEDE